MIVRRRCEAVEATEKTHVPLTESVLDVGSYADTLGARGRI